MIIDAKFEENGKELDSNFGEVQFLEVAPYIKDGYWWVGNVNTNVKAEGTDGKDGKDGIDGVNGKDGADGETPYIKDGYWWIGETNTNVKAEGVDGKDGANGLDGKDGADGKDGENGKDGKDGESGVYVGSDTPDTDVNVWIDPDAHPTGTVEGWTFTLEDGSTVTKLIVVLG